MSQLKKGAALTYLNILITNIVGILLTPYIIRKLGNSEYGLYTLIGSFIAYLSLMNLGINNTIIRFVAKYRAENDKKGEQVFLGTTMWIYIFISFTLTVIGLLLYYNFDAIFSSSLTPDELQKAKIMFLILVGNLAIALPGGTFMAICNAYEEFVFSRTYEIIKYIVRAILIFSILFFGGKAISIIVLDTILTVFGIIFVAFFVVKNLKTKISMRVYDSQLIKEIFSYSLWIFIFGIVYKFQWNAGQIVLGITNDTIAVAIYGVGVLLGGYYGAFASGINSVLIPRATQMVVKGNNGKELTNTMIKIGRLNTLILSFILSGFILFGKAFIKLWVGETYSESWYIALLIMSVMTLPLIQAFGNSILEARKKNKFKSTLSLFTVGTAVVIGFILSKEYGFNGVVIPLITAMGLNSIIMNFYYKKVFGFKILYFYKNTLVKPLIVYTILLVLAYNILNLTLMNSWIQLFIYMACYSTFFLIITYFLLLNDYEKSLFKNKLS